MAGVAVEHDGRTGHGASMPQLTSRREPSPSFAVRPTHSRRDQSATGTLSHGVPAKDATLGTIALAGCGKNRMLASRSALAEPRRGEDLRDGSGRPHPVEPPPCIKPTLARPVQTTRPPLSGSPQSNPGHAPLHRSEYCPGNVPVVDATERRRLGWRRTEKPEPRLVSPDLNRRACDMAVRQFQVCGCSDAMSQPEVFAVRETHEALTRLRESGASHAHSNGTNRWMPRDNLRNGHVGPYRPSDL